jgi:hypothetical protein
MNLIDACQIVAYGLKRLVQIIDTLNSMSAIERCSSGSTGMDRHRLMKSQIHMRLMTSMAGVMQKLAVAIEAHRRELAMLPFSAGTHSQRQGDPKQRLQQLRPISDMPLNTVQQSCDVPANR